MTFDNRRPFNHNTPPVACPLCGSNSVYPVIWFNVWKCDKCGQSFVAHQKVGKDE